MNKRDFLKGLAAIVSLATLPVALKSEVLAGTSISPPKIRHLHFRYDSVAMTYVKEVLSRQDPFAANIMLMQDREARKYFADIA